MRKITVDMNNAGLNGMGPPTHIFFNSKYNSTMFVTRLVGADEEEPRMKGMGRADYAWVSLMFVQGSCR